MTKPMLSEIYTEIGFGNPTFINSQLNYGLIEERHAGFFHMHLKHVYIRLYLGWIVVSFTFPFIWFRYHKKQIIFELGAFRITLKNRFNFKILLGLYGLPRKESRL